MNLKDSKMKEFKYEFKLLIFLGVLFSGIITWAYFVLSPGTNIDNQVQLRLEHQKERVLRDDVIRKLTKSGYGKLNQNQKDSLGMLFEQWDTILKQEHALFRAEQSSAQQNIAIWLSIIAAICTILPIVIGINQNMSFKSQVELLRKEFQKAVDSYTEQLQKEVDTFNQEVCEYKKEVCEYKKDVLQSKFSELVNAFSVNLRILAELEEIEIHQNVLLTCPNLLKEQLEKLENRSRKFREDYQDVLNKISSRNKGGENQNNSENDSLQSDIQEIEEYLKENLVDVYILMNNLLKKYEPCFDDDLLFRVHDTMDQLWYKTNEVLDTDDQNKVKIQDHIESICYYIRRIKEIFIELIKRKNAS